jgi:TPR repeat protein
MRISLVKKKSYFAFVLAFATSFASHAKSAVEVYENVSRSVVVVYGHDSTGKRNVIGSGVVLPGGDVATACHVVRNASSSVVKYDGKEYKAQMVHSDYDRDVCLLRLPSPLSPSIKFGSSEVLKIGQRVYAVGAPKGLELTLSDGVVSSFRSALGARLIQTTAAVSPGSSGGGLFDEEGRLVGLVTFYFKDGQQLNFAVPVESIPGARQPLDSSKKSLQETRRPSANDAGASTSLEVDGSEQCQLLATRRSKFLDRAIKGDALAQYCVAKSYLPTVGSKDDPARACRIEQEAEKWFEKAAKQGLPDAQFYLGLSLLIRSDSTQAAALHRKAAESGNAEAMYYFGQALELGEGVPKNEVSALMWFNLAAARQSMFHSIAATNRDNLAKRLSREEVVEAQKLSSAWKPRITSRLSSVQVKPEQCE